VAHVYHWKHGWIPLDHTAALSKAKGNHAAAARMLGDAHDGTAGMHSRQDVAKALVSLPDVPAADRPNARAQIAEAAARHNSADLLPTARPTAGRGGAAPTAVSALFDRSRMTPAQEREHVRNVQQQLSAATSARATADPSEAVKGKTDAELEIMAKRSPLPPYREAAQVELSRRTAAAAPADLRSHSDEHLATMLGTADDADVERIVAELDRRDKAERTRQAGIRRREQRDAERDDEYQKRIASGDDAEQAYADVYGVTVERQHRDQAIGALRGQGYKGAGFDALSTAAYHDHVSEQMVDAEMVTRGALFKGLTRANETRNLRRLFTDERYARAHASEELRRYWEESGGWLSLADFRASMLSGRITRGRASWY
jgi:hypothetical protein